MIERLQLLWLIFNPRWFFMPLFEDRPTSYKRLPYELLVSMRILGGNIKRLIKAKFNPKTYSNLQDEEDDNVLHWLFKGYNKKKWLNNIGA